MSSGPNSFSRREFVRLAASGALGLTLARAASAAELGDSSHFNDLVPADKKLSRAWIDALTARGTPQVLAGDELRYVGMPIGGIGTGQIYLGGDGRLWHWDIFNHFVATSNQHYAQPVLPTSPLTQWFTLSVGDRTWPLSSEGFKSIGFRGEYPIGTVHYRDSDAPVEIALEAFSPFIPLELESSSLPVTALQFEIRNSSSGPVDGLLSGQLENAVCCYSRDAVGRRINRVISEPGFTLLESAVEASATSSGLEQLPDYGTMGIALLGTAPDQISGDAAANLSEKLVGSIGRKIKLAPGETVRVVFLIGWSFPNLSLPPVKRVGRYCAVQFPTAADAVRQAAAQFPALREQTRLWRDTWYDSTLPYWFLDRTMLNTSTLATSTTYRFANGRFWAWEGVNSCAGTCTHVWGYAQAVGRLFPELERDARERTDYGLALTPEGAIGFRGELAHRAWAVDGQAMVILRTLREHQVSANDAFLRRVWPHAKLALSALMARDTDADGLLNGGQPNTLDSTWYGDIAWTSGLYLAAVRAGEELARAMGDSDFADRCRGLAKRGGINLTAKLFQDGYFINRIDPAHLDAINSGTGCHIDQVLGQSWAWQVALGRVLPQAETRRALRSIWRYNFAPDVGPYRAAHKPGRWFAEAGESGLIMTTFPRADWSFEQAKGTSPKASLKTYGGYFDECMNGFEYQVAGHMIWEGMVTEGLAITRAVHDRYSAAKRNPWNEVEAGDHYARSMASYGVFLAACGFEYQGPNGHLGFAPRITPENFRAAFTAAEGWGTFAQQKTVAGLAAQLTLRWGKLRLKTLALQAPRPLPAFKVFVAGAPVAASVSSGPGRRAVIAFENEISLDAGQELRIELA